MVHQVTLAICFALLICLLFSAEQGVAAISPPVITRFGEQEDLVAPRDFVFNLGGSQPAAEGPGGLQFVMSQENTPGLRLGSVVNRGGGEQVLFRFEPCGFRTPHHHPRGVENFFVIEGEVAANFITESGNLVSNNVSAGLGGHFPLAHIHFLQNTGCKPAKTLSILDNMDPGVYDVASVLNLPTDTIQVTLDQMALAPSEALFASILPQSQECLRRCGLI